MSGFENNPDQPDTDTLLRRVVDVINNGKSVPLSTSVLISNKDEVMDLLEAAIARFPEELDHARFMLRERAEYLARVQREADEILDAARSRAERMVQRTEIVREAEHRAQRMVDDAREQSARLRHEADDYCDRKLAAFEVALERTMRSVQAGREKLRVTAPPPPEDEEPSELLGEGGPADQVAFFDQDL